MRRAMKPQGPRAEPLPSLHDRIQRDLEGAESPNAAVQQRINALFSEISGQGRRGWAYLANCLFFAIARHHGDAAARNVFDDAGPMPKRLRAALKNAALLERLGKMKPKPNKAQLAREVAKENKKRKLPKEQQRGADGTNASNLQSHIRDQVKAHKKWRAKHPLPGAGLKT
jgi:hypothetical protein